MSSFSSSCRWGSREGRKRAKLGFFKVSFQMEMTWIEEIITCSQKSRMCFPSWTKKKTPWRQWNVTDYTVPGWSWILQVLSVGREVRLNPVTQKSSIKGEGQELIGAKGFWVTCLQGNNRIVPFNPTACWGRVSSWNKIEIHIHWKIGKNLDVSVLGTYKALELGEKK